MEGEFISVNSFLVGKYPCLWCLITYETMQLSSQDPRRGHIEKRGLTAEYPATYINKLCSAVLAKTEELCPSLLSKAREISVKFEQAFKLFAACLLFMIVQNTLMMRRSTS